MPAPAAPPVKVAHLATIDFSVAKLMIDKLEGLRARGYDVHILSSPGIYHESIRARGFTYHTVPIPRAIAPPADLAAVWRLWRIFRRERYTIVHTHTAKAGFTGRVAAWLARVPLVIHTSHGLPFFEGQSRGRFRAYLALERLAGRLSDFIFSQNEEDLANIARYRLIDPARTAYEGNGVNVARIDAETAGVDPAAVRRELGIEPGTMLVGYFARFEPVKGHAQLIDAVAELAPRHPGMVVALAGKGWMEAEVRAEVERRGLGRHLRFIGFRQDTWAVARACDIVALASEKEGIPRIIMEAMALRRPVVATDVLGTREVVADGETGWLVPWGDAGALAEKLEDLLTHPERRAAYGEAGRRRVETHFEEGQVVGRIDAVYRRLLAGKGLRPPEGGLGAKNPARDA